MNPLTVKVLSWVVASLVILSVIVVIAFTTGIWPQTYIDVRQ